MRSRRSALVSLALLVALSTSVLAAGSPSSNGYDGWERRLTHLPNVGEPEIAVTDTGSIVVSFNGCGIAVSHDRGTTWTVRAKHPADPGPTPGDPFHNCSDPVAAAGPGGTLYVGAGYWDQQPAGVVDYYNMYVSRSDDGGATWHRPVFATGDRDVVRILRLGRNSGHSDRAFLTVDNATGVVYVSATDFPRMQRWIVASHDEARTFGAPRAIDSARYPELGGQLGADYVPAAANGRLAIDYVAAAAPGNGCPCNIFETTRDDGLTWERHFTPLAANWVAADTRRPGHYAIMSGEGVTASPANPDSVAVSTTADYGKTWTTPVLIGQRPPHPRIEPWIAYSPNGTLGVGYKTLYAATLPYPQALDLALTFGSYSGRYDYWTAVSFDDGKTFSAPLRLSHADSPFGSGGGDDFSSVALDDDYLYASWGDLRTSPSNPARGPVAIYFGRVPLTAYGLQRTSTDASRP